MRRFFLANNAANYRGVPISQYFKWHLYCRGNIPIPCSSTVTGCQSILSIDSVQSGILSLLMLSDYWSNWPEQSCF